MLFCQIIVNLGRENDAVQANAQDGAGFNNANMMTPIDGNRGATFAIYLVCYAFKYRTYENVLVERHYSHA